ncbi:hypothetical protein EF888_18280 [Silicimonas algicola]|uniref:hypothetical protein n=1 Tax=Silicimonas algicola TaxID=1826607 RepID=UPI000D6DB31B|nr:hypothetical protein [Silicimonas algicola]AZQ68902.1 hypothetical protein EF888_18280 [Silicimonas algicola]
MKTIPEIRLEMKPKTREAKAVVGFDWAEDGVGKRSKIGGRPDFLQGREDVGCDSCGEEMTFFAQLDSVGDEICFADVGMVFVFVCFDCFRTKSLIQSG